MINILLDECIPKKLKFRIDELDPAFFVKTVPEMGWASFTNGDLLSVSEEDFDVFITSDKNLSFQQSVSKTSMHIILLKAKTNTYKDLLPLVKKLSPYVKNHSPNSFTEIEY
jgi:hypothetical protein